MEINSRTNISVVIPVCNEEEVLPLLYDRTIKVLEGSDMSYEIIFVNDGSDDISLKIIKEFNKKNPKVKVVSFSRNFGHQVAVTAGLHYASGDCVVVMDADLQDPPEVIPEMIKKWQEGFDVVYGIRRHRKEGWIKRGCYRIFYQILHKISWQHIPVDAGDFSLMSKRAVIKMRELPEDRPFVRGLRHWIGFKQAGVEYERDKRKASYSKYNFLGLFKLALDGILSFSVIMLRAATLIGIIVSFISIAYAIFIAINRMLTAFGLIDTAKVIPVGWATLTCSIMFLLGLQFIFIGILGEYLGRIFMQVKGRPLFVVEEEVGF